MKNGDRRYTIHWNQSGQIRRYGPTIRDFTIQVDWISYKKREPNEALEWEPNDLAESLIDASAKTLGSNFKTSEENPEWHMPKLKSKSKLGPGQWRYVIEEEYTD